jgi:hypothetical protein
VGDGIYEARKHWAVDHQAQENMLFVIRVGDITDDNEKGEWEVADRAHDMLDAAGVPYSMVPENHDNPDHGRKWDTTKHNDWFGSDRFDREEWYGGLVGNPFTQRTP